MDNKEYVFCPYCGGISPQGVCVNCGMNMEQSANSQQDDVEPMHGQYIDGEPVYGYVNPQPTQYYNNASTGTYNNTSTGAYNNTSSGMYNNDMYNQSYNTYVQPPKEKKSKWWIWLLIIALVLLIGGLLIAIIAIVAVIIAPLFFVNNVSSTTVSQQVPVAETAEVISVEADETASSTEVYVYPRELERMDFVSFDWEAYAQSALHYSETSDGSNDIFLASDYTSTFGSNHENHSIDEFSGEYYEPFVDCIDTNQNYGLSRHFIEYSNVHDYLVVNGYIAYIQLEGGTVPNEEALNQQILEMTANDLFGHISGQKVYTGAYQSVTYIVDSFVTYNDGEKMSILLDVNIVADDSTFADSYIYGINIDLVNGVILDNESIIEADEDFAAMFREKCCTQNGTDIVALNAITDAELAAFLGDASTNIIFYSPYGLEVGYAYESLEDSVSSRGWATITIKDYEQYLQ